ncbi:MAG: type II secretion system protein [Pseudomonadota bacterium]
MCRNECRHRTTGLRSPALTSPRRQSGVTLIELALAILIITLIAGLGTLVGSGALSRSEVSQNVQQMTLLQNNLRRFIIAQNRLPCPDVDGDGQEDCVTPAHNIGGVPHDTLGISDQLTDSNGQPLLYGANPVIQQPASVASAPWDFPGSSRDRFCAALRDRIGLGFDDEELTVAGQSSNACTAGGGAFNPAFAAVSSGVDDADGDGDFFDGLNLDAARNGAICVDNPGRQVDDDYDDQVRSIGLSELHGDLCMGSRDDFDAALWGGP